MAVEGELARAGIVTLIDRTLFTKDAEFGGDVSVDGDVHVAGATVVDGTLIVAGGIQGTLTETYVLDSKIDDLSAADGCYVVVPFGGDGYISHIRTVLLDTIATSDAVLSTNVNGGTDIDAAYDVTIGYSGSGAGDVDDSGDIPITEGHNTVAEGDYIKVYPSTPAVSAEGCYVQIEVTRT